MGYVSCSMFHFFSIPILPFSKQKNLTYRTVYSAMTLYIEKIKSKCEISPSWKIIVRFWFLLWIWNMLIFSKYTYHVKFKYCIASFFSRFHWNTIFVRFDVNIGIWGILERDGRCEDLSSSVFCVLRFDFTGDAYLVWTKSILVL